jgi:hypothetical protein
MLTRTPEIRSAGGWNAVWQTWRSPRPLKSRGDHPCESASECQIRGESFLCTRAVPEASRWQLRFEDSWQDPYKTDSWHVYALTSLPQETSVLPKHRASGRQRGKDMLHFGKDILKVTHNNNNNTKKQHVTA